MGDVLRSQYELVRQGRGMVLDVLDSLPGTTLHAPVEGFGHRTVARTYAHAADSYRYWFDAVVVGGSRPTFMDALDPDPGRVDGRALRSMFARVDVLVDAFIRALGRAWDLPLVRPVAWLDDPLPLTPLCLVTHTTTHEFHHKGQIVAMLRRLGTPLPGDRLGGRRFPAPVARTGEVRGG